MRLADIIKDVETTAVLGTARRNTVRRAIQERLFMYAASYDWPHYRDRGTIRTVNDVTAGTVAITNGSTTVTGSSTAFTALMVGRKFRVGTGNDFYYIAARASDTSITLRDPYQGETVSSGGSYTIFQDEYRLDGNTHKLLDMIQIEDSLVMVGLSYLDMDRWFPDPDQLNDPIYFSMIGRRDDRLTGTLGVVAGDRTLTGSSTTWLSEPGFSRGIRISIDDTDEVFTIDTVDSDTSLEVYELPATTDSSTGYRAFMNNLVVQVRDVPDAARNIYYRKQRIPYPLTRDADEPDLPREYHYGLVWGGLVTAFALQGNTEASREAERRWNSWLAIQRSQVAIDSPAIDYPRSSVDGFLRDTRAYNRLPVNFGYLNWF